MSADILRRAAKTLRESVEGTTGHPWLVEHVSPEYAVVHHAGDGIVRLVGAVLRSDSAYIALMHPPVALALAEWLEAEAITLDRHYPVWKDSYDVADVDAHVERMFAGPLATARAILRETAS